MNMPINVLVACEESQTVCMAFRALGVNAYSCDIVECSGNHPEYHFKEDMFKIIDNKGGITQNGNIIHVNKWHLLIAHPPCTYLSVSGACWYYHPDDKHLPTNQRRPHPNYPNRQTDKQNAIDFFLKIARLNIDRIAIENPVGIMSTNYRKPNQIVQPYMFGDEASKKTCLWLKNLPNLTPTKIVDKGEFVTYASGCRMPKWYADAAGKKDRQKIRSKTFPGMAEAMATQWLQAIKSDLKYENT